MRYEDVAECKTIGKTHDEGRFDCIEEPCEPRRAWWKILLHYISLILITIILGAIPALVGFCWYFIEGACQWGYNVGDDVVIWWEEN